MISTLWSSNTPQRFWLCEPDATGDQWAAAMCRALPVLGLPSQTGDVDDLLALVLGEGQFGPNHWRLSLARRCYYVLKPVLPRRLVVYLRKAYSSRTRARSPLGWPIEDRYVRFQWEVLRQLLIETGQQSIAHRPFWPDGRRFAFVLTHDIETAEGQAHAREVADLDASFGFRSSFNFVLEEYPLDYELIADLRQRGFEIGIHGRMHDGKLFASYATFLRQAESINRYLKQLGAVGFRSPLTLRHPEWMQALEIQYDSSFFDTDPYEPLPGGTMSIWPFILGRFVELPYTLAQDNTLVGVLGEKTARLWLEKVEFIERYRGMALLNSHPDYLPNPLHWKIYASFLEAIKSRGGYWNALPRDVAAWWCARSAGATDPCLEYASVRADNRELELDTVACSRF